MPFRICWYAGFGGSGVRPFGRMKRLIVEPSIGSSCGVMPPGMKRPCFFVPPTVSESHHVWNCLIWSGCQLSGTPNSRSGTLPSV
ncbi:Uncharacterised protein [Burkholderia pseudomallei]|nr:Uncharacterised protein [Burkholderia pseudomallei]CPJ20664.1 Uncharacterised protein [Burkholderia pseudomallei]